MFLFFNRGEMKSDGKTTIINFQHYMEYVAYTLMDKKVECRRH